MTSEGEPTVERPAVRTTHVGLKRQLTRIAALRHVQLSSTAAFITTCAGATIGAPLRAKPGLEVHIDSE